MSAAVRVIDPELERPQVHVAVHDAHRLLCARDFGAEGFTAWGLAWVVGESEDDSRVAINRMVGASQVVVISGRETGENKRRKYRAIRKRA